MSISASSERSESQLADVSAKSPDLAPPCRALPCSSLFSPNDPPPPRADRTEARRIADTGLKPVGPRGRTCVDRRSSLRWYAFLQHRTRHARQPQPGSVGQHGRPTPASLSPSLVDCRGLARGCPTRARAPRRSPSAEAAGGSRCRRARRRGAGGRFSRACVVDRFRLVARLSRELDREHRPEASAPRRSPACPAAISLEPAADQAADRLGALAEARLGEGVEHGAGRGAARRDCRRTSSQPAGMRPRPSTSDAPRHGSERQAAAERLAGDDQVGLDVQVLDRPWRPGRARSRTAPRRRRRGSRAARRSASSAWTNSAGIGMKPPSPWTVSSTMHGDLVRIDVLREEQLEAGDARPRSRRRGTGRAQARGRRPARAARSPACRRASRSWPSSGSSRPWKARSKTTTPGRPVAARAILTAFSTASAPELTSSDFVPVSARPELVEAARRPRRTARTSRP